MTLAKLLFGIAALSEGRRIKALGETLDGLLELFDDRLMPFDTAPARHYADLAAAARVAGKGLPTPDEYIAAIAASKGVALATRDSSPNEAADVPVVNPWSHLQVHVSGDQSKVS